MIAGRMVANLIHLNSCLPISNSIYSNQRTSHVGHQGQNIVFLSLQNDGHCEYKDRILSTKFSFFIQKSIAKDFQILLVFLMASLISRGFVAASVLTISGVFAGTPLTCSNPQLSCQNTTTVSDLCCFNAPGGQLLQTQFWDSCK